MFCKICGTFVEGEKTLCPQCQEKMNISERTAESVPKYSKGDWGSAAYNDGELSKDKPKEKWPVILSVAFVALVVAGIICNILNLINFSQLALGLTPGVIGVWVILAVKKTWNKRNVSVGIAVSLICLMCFFAGSPSSAAYEKSSYKNLSKETALELCYAAISQGNYELAETLLDEYSIYGVYDDDISLAKSRIESIKGNYKSALGILSKLKSDSAEKEILTELVKEDNYDEAMADFAQDNGMEMPKVDNVTSQSKYNHQDLEKIVVKEAKAMCSKEYLATAGILNDIETVYNTYKETGNYEKGKVQKLRKDLDTEIEQHGELRSLHAVRVLKLKSDILAEEYKSAVSELRADSFYDEYMIASELLINEYVDEKDFPKEFYNYSKDDAQAVINHLENLKKEKRLTMSPEDYEAFCKEADRAKRSYENPVAGALIYGMEEKIASNEVRGDATKVYMQIAKIEDYYGDEKAAKERIRDAMTSVGLCDDASYVEPMVALVSVSSGNNDEAVKDVAQYVDYVLENTVPVKLTANPSQTSSTIVNGDETEIMQNSFKELLKNYIVESSLAITISSVDTSNFEKIKSRVVFSNEFFESETLDKNDIILKDCGIKIDDFTMEKIDFSGAEVLLCCDNSGSMSGSIDELQDAVRSFIKGREEGEEVSVVTFDSTILETQDFTTNESSLNTIVDGMSARGGTDVLGTAIECLDDFSSGSKTNKVMILMTDGDDGRDENTSEIYDELQVIAAQKGITVYTIGLGSGVKIQYLTAIAECTGGSFIYASQAYELEAFFDFVRSKMNNQYEVSYKAVDTLTATSRTLNIAFSDNSSIYDEYIYNIATEDTTLFELEEGITLLGVSPKNLYKGSMDQTVYLNGTGLKSTNKISVKLIGRLTYDVKAEFVDEYKVALTIPKDVYTDVYDLEVHIDGKRAYLKEELSIISQENLKEVEFGPYKFTAASIAEMDSTYLLKGNVTMNGWLHFKGDITLSGDLNSGSIKMTDYSGSYAEYKESTAIGLAKLYAKRGVAQNVPPLGEFYLYNDTNNLDDYESYRADDIKSKNLRLISVINIPELKAKLLPDRVMLTFTKTTSILPCQELVVLYAGDAAELFDIGFDEEVSAVITDKNIGLKISQNYSDLAEEPTGTKDMTNSEGNLKDAKISTLPISVDLDETGISIDTLKGEYKLSLGFKCNKILGISGASVAMEWKDFELDKVELGIDKKITTTIHSVPVTFRKFKLGIEDLAETKGGFIEKFKKATFVGKMNVEMYSLTATAPKIAEYLSNNENVKDMYLLGLPDTTLKVNVSDMAFEFDANLKLLNTVELASANVKLGKFNYKNDMLCANDQAFGLQASFTRGLKWDIKNFEAQLTGTLQANLHSRFVGAGGNAKAKLKLDLWVFDVNIEETADAFIGMHFPVGNPARFVIGYKTNGKKIESKLFYINLDGSKSK